ncbi:MAG: DUF1800 domain-containing protein [bacterium]|nr:DUF1800 domain-containing protein [bacterium]
MLDRCEGPRLEAQNRFTPRVASVSTLLLLLTMASFLAACSGAQDEEHALLRFGYGPDAYSRERIRELGPRPYLEEQLYPESIPDDDFDAMMAAYAWRNMDYRTLEQTYCWEDCPAGTPWDLQTDLRKAKIQRAIYSRRQLEAVLTDFWFNHFNVYAPSGVRWTGIVPYERDAIRAHVFGKFEDMLVAVATSPSMMEYLDNTLSTQWGINENYGRELLELHTMGVDGGYTQEDIIEVARAFTGWQVSDEWDENATESGFFFNEEDHDPGSKSILGGDLVIPPGGEMQDGFDVLHHLALRPETADFLTRKLAERFIGGEPHELTLNYLSNVYLETGGDLREVTRAMFQTAEFWFMTHRRTKVKRPLMLVASTARALGATGPDLPLTLTWYLNDLGEDLYAYPLPTGYPDDSSYWMNTGNLLSSINVGYASVRGWSGYQYSWDIAFEDVDQAADAVIRRMLLNGASDHTRTKLVELGEALPAWTEGDRMIDEMGAALVASPEFLMH